MITAIWTIVMIAAIIIFFVIPSLKTRVIPIRKLAITPVVFMVLLYQSITENFSLDTTSKLLLPLGLISGILIGILLRKPVAIQADKNAKLIQVPGSYVNLAMFLAIFAVHFASGWLRSVYPAMFHANDSTKEVFIFLLTMVSALTVGTSLCLYAKYRKTISVVLKR